MDSPAQFFAEQGSVAYTVLVLSLVAASGLLIGSIRLLGVNLGTAGVLFAGLLFGHYRFSLDEAVLSFVREFGLIIFVYTIGLQAGPGFLAAFRRQGLPLNLLAAGIVVLGAGITVIIAKAARIDMPVAVGIFSGATTNTPSLAAAQQALKEVANGHIVNPKLPGLGYAVAYPFGILGIILTMIASRAWFKINLAREAEELSRLEGRADRTLATINLVVRNPNCRGLRIRDLPLVSEHDVVISRVLKGKTLEVALPETRLQLGDVLLAVGPKPRLEQLRLTVGEESDTDLRLVPSNIITRRIVITKTAALGKTIPELDLVRRYAVSITRVSRAEIDFTPAAQFRLQFGDTVLAVGDPSAVEHVAAELGNSLKRLNHPQLVPVFVGIALGVLLGSIPLKLPGVPAPVKLGLAGGPLLAAIVLSRIGRIGPLVWYMPISANFVLREIGIVLFLACVGLKAGDRFVETLVSGNGLQWVLAGAIITLLPLVIAALVARICLRLNYLYLCGLLAGSMTDPPALAFATSLAGSDAPSVSYSSVYPLVMLLRVICAQAMVLFFMN